MWLILLFTLLNVGLSLLGHKVFRLPGFDLTPLGIILIAQNGESVLLGTFFLTAAFSFHSLKKVRYLWLTVPATLIVGYLALVIPSLLLLLLIYHLICAVCALLLGFFGFRYFTFVLSNLAVNLVGLRFYGFVKL